MGKHAIWWTIKIDGIPFQKAQIQLSPAYEVVGAATLIIVILLEIILFFLETFSAIQENLEPKRTLT